MKPETNNDNKAKFFAQYWGQKETGSDYYGEIMPDTWNDFPINITNQYLIVTPLSQLTDEELLQLAKNYWGDQYIEGWSDLHTIDWGKKLVSGVAFDSITNDYLRFKGYAIPWMGLSVEELIEAGWVKLKK
jgi:hypothetical protein